MVETVIKNPNWWKRRTALERMLTLISVAAIIAVLALAISLIVVSLAKQNNENSGSPPMEGDAVEKISAQALQGHHNEKLLASDESTTIKTTTTTEQYEQKKPEEFCTTEDCIHSASNVLGHMNQKIEPCDDFYNFACGNFIKNTIIPDDQVSVTTFSLISERLQEQLRLLVSEEVGENESKPFTIAKNIFKACMNKQLIETRGQEPLLNIHKQFGGWPVVEGDSWDDNAFDWIEMTKQFRKHGFNINYLIDFQVSTNIKNTTSRIIYLDQASIGLFREFLILGIEENAVKAYYNYAVDMAILFGADRARAESEMMDSLNFEMALANISLPREKRRNESELYNAMTLREAQVNYTYVNWVEYINNILPEGISVDENEVVVNRVPSFLEGFGELLKKTPKRTIANYLMWRITGISSFFMNDALRKRQLKFTKDVLGKEEEEPRWKECVDIASGTHGLPIQLGAAISVSALYIRKHFNEDSKKVALEMVNSIRSQFETTLNTVDWMDDETRATGREKLHAMDEHIGYPNELMDDKNLERYYAKLEIDPEMYLESVLNMSIFGNDYLFNKLRLPVNKTDWETHSRAAVVGAYYTFAENSIQFPAGILQGHFFSAGRPRYMNYGAIGLVIGHEITHGFDDQGRQFDENGNLFEWWAPSTKTAYLDKAQCIIDQYGNYTELTTNLYLNGINTQGENIADNGGVKQSYLAYQNWVKENGPEPKLPGLSYSPEQLFWISAAQNWCAVFRTEAMKLRIKTGVHSPTEFRVLGPFSNIKDFSKDFNCPIGSRMNPVEKCEVW